MWLLLDTSTNGRLRLQASNHFEELPAATRVGTAGLLDASQGRSDNPKSSLVGKRRTLECREAVRTK